MTVTAVTKDPERCSMTILVEYPVSAGRVW